MKTIRLIIKLYLLSFAGILMFSSCSKEETDPVSSFSQSGEKTTALPQYPSFPVFTDWRDDFTSESSLNSRWTFYGESKPGWTYNAFGRFGLLENNGVATLGSSAVSKARVGSKQGYVIESEVYIDVQNPGKGSISPEIGITRYENISSDPGFVEAGISLKMIYLGSESPVVPANNEDKIYIQTSSLSYDGTYQNSGNLSINTEEISDTEWHKLKIVVGSDQKVSFYLDDQLIFKPSKKIHPSLMTNRNVILGYLSSGIAGKAYRDYVKVSYPLPD